MTVFLGPIMDTDKLHNHIHESYHVLRIGLVWIAAVFPFALVGLGLLIYGIPMQKTMSHYYFALQDPEVWSFPMRGLFVGVLCAVGCALIMYRGYSPTENWALNIAGLAAILVGLVHMGAPEPKTYGGYVIPWAKAHYFFAVTFFALIIVVAVACSEETLGDLPKDRQQPYRNAYDRHAAGMLTFPALAAVFTYATGYWENFVLAMEAFGVWIFARFWRVKSKEIKEIEAFRRKGLHKQRIKKKKRIRASMRKHRGKRSTWEVLPPQDKPAGADRKTIDPELNFLERPLNGPTASAVRRWLARFGTSDKMDQLPRQMPEPQRRVPIPKAMA